MGDTPSPDGMNIGGSGEVSTWVSSQALILYGQDGGNQTDLLLKEAHKLTEGDARPGSREAVNRRAVTEGVVGNSVDVNGNREGCVA